MDSHDSVHGFVARGRRHWAGTLSAVLSCPLPPWGRRKALSRCWHHLSLPSLKHCKTKTLFIICCIFNIFIIAIENRLPDLVRCTGLHSLGASHGMLSVWCQASHLVYTTLTSISSYCSASGLWTNHPGSLNFPVFVCKTGVKQQLEMILGRDKIGRSNRYTALSPKPGATCHLVNLNRCWKIEGIFPYSLNHRVLLLSVLQLNSSSRGTWASKKAALAYHWNSS